MESEILVPADGLNLTLHNGFHEHVSDTAADNLPSDIVSEGNDEGSGTAALPENIENAVKLSGIATNESTLREVAEEREENNVDHPEQIKSGKGQKSKNEKSSTKHISSTRVKKNTDGKEQTPSVVNGSGISHPHTKQASKSRSFNDRQAQLPKQAENFDGESLQENTNLKPLKKGPPSKSEGDSEASLSPRTGDEKSRVGRLPNYGFSFKCNERAEKRKEFYTKLEEKIHAKEVEKTTLQAKSKETQEAEIRMLRKSLNFKATPMPSFYQEPPPPKVELKKIPPTRAKSPKLGRKKCSIPADSPSNDGVDIRVGRLSLDENMAVNNNSKGLSPPVRLEKPKRRSLPRLPSEKVTISGVMSAGKSSAPKVKNVEKAAAVSSNGKKEGKPALSDAIAEKTTGSRSVDEEKTASSNATNEENGVAIAEVSESHTDEESVDEEPYQQHGSEEEVAELEQSSNT